MSFRARNGRMASFDTGKHGMVYSASDAGNRRLGMRIFLPALAMAVMGSMAVPVLADENALFPASRGGRQPIVLQDSTAEDVVGQCGNPSYVGPSEGFATQIEQATAPASTTTTTGMKVYGELPRSVLPGAAAPKPDLTVYVMYDRGVGKMVFGFDPRTGVVVAMMAVGDSLPGARTSKGVTLGNTMSDVTRAYGFPERQQFTGAGLVVYYPDDNVAFAFTGLRVTGITIGKQFGISVERQVRRMPVIQTPGYGPGTTASSTYP
jgi:hypothetical protein